MKKNITIYLSIVLVALIFSSCKTVQVAKFTSVENVMELQVDYTLDQVIAKLGSKPYNIYSNQKDGYTIYTYKYKLVERKVNPDLVNSKGGETTGTEVYNNKEQTLFLIFKEGKLEAFVTTEGRRDANPLVLINNTLFTISKEKGEYIMLPVKEEENSSSGIPFGKNKK